jgi:hypothetical protein
MATFVRVTRNQSGVVIFVNMDKVILMERTQKSYTILKPNNADFTSELVNETPEDILDLIHHERKSQV